MSGRPQRVHVSYVWLGALKNVAAIVIALAIGTIGALVSAAEELAELAQMVPHSFDGSEPGLLLALLAPLAVGLLVLLVGMAVAVLARWVSWRCLTYQLTVEEFSVRCGVLNKKHFHVPYGRIQSVDVRASLLQRVIGVCSLEVDTAGGALNKAVVVPYLAKSAAMQLKAELFRRKHAGAAGCVPTATALAKADESAGRNNATLNVLDGVDQAFAGARGLFDSASFVEAEPVTFQARLTNMQLLLSGLSGVNGSAITIVFWVLGLCLTFGALDFAVEYAANALDAFLGAEVPAELLIRRLMPSVLPAFLGLCVVSFAAAAAISAVTSLVSYGGFQVRRQGNRIEVESGLLQRTTQGIDVARIQLLHVEHGWIRRRFGYCKVVLGRVSGAAGEDSDQQSATLDQAQGMVVHPFLKVDQLDAFLQGLLPEFANGYAMVHAGKVAYAGKPAQAGEPAQASKPVQVGKPAHAGERTDENPPAQTDLPAIAAPPATAKLRAVLRYALWWNAGFWALVVSVPCLVVGGAFVMQEGPEEAALFALVLKCASPLLLLPVASVAIGVVRGLKWHAGSSLAYDRGFVLLANDGFTCREALVPRQKIQFTALVANPFQQAAGLRTVQIATAAGSGGTKEELWDLPLQDAAAFQDWYRPRA